MKLQSLSIIFIIIVFPLILVLSYYISLQIDTVTLYNKYNNELIDATNDAMAAFELNTANEELSNVSDSLRTIINASTNTFINTFSTSLGLSNAHKSEIEPYIPSILYTMYDGYYIYAPTRTPVILEDTVKNDTTGIITSNGAKYNNEGSLLYKRNEADTTGSPNINDAMYKTDYVLKSYMPYSATYHDDSNDNDKVDPNENIATINYTLDNFMSVSARLGDIYYTKSGYYIENNIVQGCSGITDWETIGQDRLLEECRKGESVEIKLKDGTEITYNPIRENLVDPSSRILTVEESEKELELLYKDYQSGDTSVLEDIRTIEVELANNKAITYYLTNTAFSNWVNDNLGFCTGQNMQIADNTAGYMLENIDIFYNFSEDDQMIFSGGSDPENEDSAFNNHKYNVIKNSIQYNLNLAISSYNNMFNGINFEMPQLSYSEWEEITQKISIVSFAQGLKCGLKKYNGYVVISSTNNEMTVIPEELYYVEKDKFNDEINFYHRIDCENIKDYATGDFISFKSKEVKYDDIYTGDTTSSKEGYEYDHKNLACYKCIAQNNYSNYDSNSDTIYDKKIKLRAFLNLEKDDYEGKKYPEDISYYGSSVLNGNLKKAYLIAIAKERQNLYKTTAYSKNEGIETYENSTISDLDLGKVSKFEITLRNNDATGGIIKTIECKTGTDTIGTANISGTTTSNQTITIQNTKDGNNKTIEVNGTDISIISIKVIYK